MPDSGTSYLNNSFGFYGDEWVEKSALHPSTVAALGEQDITSDVCLYGADPPVNTPKRSSIILTRQKDGRQIFEHASRPHAISELLCLTGTPVTGYWITPTA